MNVPSSGILSLGFAFSNELIAVDLPVSPIINRDRKIYSSLKKQIFTLNTAKIFTLIWLLYLIILKLEINL
jgi:hypothetical protein